MSIDVMACHPSPKIGPPKTHDKQKWGPSDTEDGNVSIAQHRHQPGGQQSEHRSASPSTTTGSRSRGQSRRRSARIAQHRPNEGDAAAKTTPHRYTVRMRQGCTHIGRVCPLMSWPYALSQRVSGVPLYFRVTFRKRKSRLFSKIVRKINKNITFTNTFEQVVHEVLKCIFHAHEMHELIFLFVDWEDPTVRYAPPATVGRRPQSRKSLSECGRAFLRGVQRCHAPSGTSLRGNAVRQKAVYHEQ